ncbi:acyltransferase family protein [Mediterraneibacter gnavus]|uniref:acyltransferase family protein n=1 Tax=Mediterraneibacter gnavus TaxID=33038 RepID=UPI0036D415E3
MAKGIGIFLVVFAHIYTMGTNSLGDIIYVFHMPLFFLLSGITTNCNKDFKKYVKQNAYSILVCCIVDI